MIKYYRGNTPEEAQSVIDTIIACKGGKIQTTPVKTSYYFTNVVYGYVVVVLEKERECLTPTTLNALVDLPDGIYSE